MSPVPAVGKISFTKFPQPAKLVGYLAELVPGETTAAEAESILDAPDSTSGPLWNDLIQYDPPLMKDTERADSRVVRDSELLRACRANRADAYLLLWCAFILADPRLDKIVRDVFTGDDGRLRPEMVNGAALEARLNELNDRGPENLPSDSKSRSNLLSLLETCKLIVPQKHGGSIVGVAEQLPTRHAVPGLLNLIADFTVRFGVRPVESIDFALGIGANHWLGLTHEEFRRAAEVPSGGLESVEKSVRGDLPDELQELRTQLERKRQIVLQGAPGVGKTYVARQYIEWSTSDRSDESRLQAIVESLPLNEQSPRAIAREMVRRGLTTAWEIVQFHPAYEYTDFVRALVAEPVPNGVTFVARHRMLSLICAIGTALDELGSDIDLILVLDEVNRGDISNIFGELLYALEYRDQAVATPYAVDGTTSITVPERLRLIGTMNTADRSIAVIDYALRRRFVFLDIPASPKPIQQHPGFDETARAAALYLYEKASEALSSSVSGLQIGPSYFLPSTPGLDEKAQIQELADRFIYEVLPLIREYELEGEVEKDQVDALVAELGVSAAGTQLDRAATLATHLSSAPWEPASGDD